MRPFARFFVFSLLVVLTVLLPSGCKNTGGGEHLKNQPPIARLSNVPPDSLQGKPYTASIGIPRLTLSWVGDDPDGYIVGFRYRWSYTLGSQVVNGKPVGGKLFRHTWSTVLNIMVADLVIMVDTADQNPQDVFKAYHFFATLPPEGLDTGRTNQLARGQTLSVDGVNVFASNPNNVVFPIHVNPNSGTFIFDSGDTLNLHTFEVEAIDDQAAIGKPDSVSFITPHVGAPTTKFLFDEMTATLAETTLVIDHYTDTYRGAKFVFEGSDPNSRTIEYSWSVDSVRWSPWSQTDSAHVNASDFRDPYATDHVFAVRSRNEFGVVDTLGVYYVTVKDTTTSSGTRDSAVYGWVKFYTFYPPFMRTTDKRLLVLNKSFVWADSISNAFHPSSRMIDDFYRQTFSSLGVTNYTLFDMPFDTIPTPSFLANYSTVMILYDAVSKNGYLNNRSGTVLSEKYQNRIAEYAWVGGHVIATGWNLRYQINSEESGNFFSQIVNCDIGPINYKIPGPAFDSIGTLPTGSFIGSYEFAGGVAVAGTGYVNCDVDTNKLDPTWHTNVVKGWDVPVNHGLAFIYPLVPTGWGENLFLYRSQNGLSAYDQGSVFGGVNIGIRYLGPTFKSVFFSFPLYYINHDQATQNIHKALIDTGELTN